MNTARTRELRSDIATHVVPRGHAAQSTLQRLARLAAQLCGAPAAVVAVLDGQERWQTAQHGPVAASRRDSALYAQVLASRTSIVVEDLASDPRFDAVVGSGPPLFACAIAPALGAEGAVVATCSVFDQAPRRFSDEQIDGLRLLAGQAADALHQHQLQDELTTLQHRERAYHELLGDAHEEALRELSDELHEGIGQDISGVAMLVSAAAQRAAPLDPQLATELREIAGLLKDTIDSCRIAAEASDGFVIAHHGLGFALTRAVESLELVPARTCAIDLDRSCEDWLDVSQAYQLLRIAQEALSNAAKHSNGTLISVALCAAGNHVVLSVSDNGRTETPNPPSLTEGIGHAIMRHRANAVGARLTISHDSHHGYQVRCEVPACRHINQLAAISPWAGKHR